MTNTEKQTAIKELQDAVTDAIWAQDKVRKAAIAAKEAGATWQQIGETEGLTKQRAQQKYATDAAKSAQVQRWETAMQHADDAIKASNELHDEITATLAELAADDKQEPATPSIFSDSPAPAPDAYQDIRPAFWVASAGHINGTAQPGTGKGPHQCPRCGSTNHKGSIDEVRAYFDCTPTKYDPQDITDYLKRTGHK